MSHLASENGCLRPEAAGLVSRNPSTIWTKLNDNVVLLSVELARYYEANPVGGMIWELLDEPRTISDIVEQVVARYDVDREQCRADVEKFLDLLNERGLLAKVDAASAKPGTE